MSAESVLTKGRTKALFNGGFITKRLTSVLSFTAESVQEAVPSKPYYSHLNLPASYRLSHV